MTMSAVTHAATAAPLAALLPSRRGTAWTVGPAGYGIRPNAATSRLTDGTRALVVAEEGGRIEVFADRPDRFGVTPDAVVDATGPDPVAALADMVLRHILPAFDNDAAAVTFNERGERQVHMDKGADLTELAFALLDLGAHPTAVGRGDGPGLAWTTADGAEFGVSSHGHGGVFGLTYDGPLGALYGALPLLLPLADGRTSTEAGSAFTRHLTDRFPQLQPLSNHEVTFRAYLAHAWVALPDTGVSPDHADESTVVTASFPALGTDLLLVLAPHLV